MHYALRLSLFIYLCTMDFILNEDQQAVKEAARDFAQNQLLPGVIDRDRDMLYPTEQVKMMGEMGFLGMMVSPEYPELRPGHGGNLQGRCQLLRDHVGQQLPGLLGS